MNATQLSAKEEHFMNRKLEEYVMPFVVPAERRLLFLPSLSDNYMRLESTVYRLAKLFCDTYNGGYWEFVEMPPCMEGGKVCPKFLFPRGERPIRFSSPMNFSSGILSPIEFGIGLSLIALSDASFTDKSPTSAVQHRALYEWIMSTDEGALSSGLFSLID